MVISLFYLGGISLIKKLIFIFLTVLISYVIYYDITFGTFPKTITQQVTNETDIQYQTIIIKSGDTLLTVVEQLSSSNLPSSDKIITDFQILNHGTKPNNLQVGATYKIPIYR